LPPTSQTATTDRFGDPGKENSFNHDEKNYVVRKRIMKLRTALTHLTQQLAHLYEAPSTTHHNAYWLLEKITQLSATNLFAQLDSYELTPLQEQNLTAYIHQLVHENKPLQYIIGLIPFGNLSLYIEPPVLIPRPETEAWCMALVQQLHELPAQPKIIIDLCTGSGCIALTLAHAFPQSTVYAVDIQPQAIALTQKNIQLNSITNCIPVLSDLYQAVPVVAADLIVSNPPYLSKDEWEAVEPHIKNWEDARALIAEDNGLSLIKKIIQKAPSFLQKHTSPTYPQLWIEIGSTQAQTVVQLFTENNFSSVTVMRDINNHDRVIAGVYV